MAKTSRLYPAANVRQTVFEQTATHPERAALQEVGAVLRLAQLPEPHLELFLRKVQMQYSASASSSLSGCIGKQTGWMTCGHRVCGM